MDRRPTRVRRSPPTRWLKLARAPRSSPRRCSRSRSIAIRSTRTHLSRGTCLPVACRDRRNGELGRHSDAQLLSAPTELPGESVPPARIVVGPTVPLPPSVPPKLTKTGEEAIEPFTLRVPAFTKVGPE